MPKYFYKCVEQNCEQIFEVVHSMKEKLQVCSQCSNTCKNEGSIERVPLNQVTISSQNKNAPLKNSTGNLVKKSIEEFRQDLKEEQKRLQQVEYKP